MKPDEAAMVVLVRSVEEVLPDSIPPERLLDAHIAAGDPSEGAPWIARRARYLVDHGLGAYTQVLSQLHVTASTWWFIVLAMIAGLAANYLGPSNKIHVVWNPMVILIVWNILVYAVLIIGSAFTQPQDTFEAQDPRPPLVHGTRARSPGVRPGIVERIILGPVVSWLLGIRAGVDEVRHEAAGFGKVARRFAILWWPLVRPVLALWLRRTLHLAAIGIAAGAILGMYVRGLFFDYNVIWQSTFMKDPDTVAILLRFLLGPAAILTGQPLPSGESIAPLFSPEGDYAAFWIHLYAVSAVLFIVVPRGFLALAATSRLARRRRSVQLDLRAAYYADLLGKAQNVRPRELEERVRGAVRDECSGVSGKFADFVCRRLYDDRIVPRLINFRETGGTLHQLEEELRRECQSFGPELQAEMAKVGNELEARVSDRVQQLLGANEQVDTRPVNGLLKKVSTESFPVTHAGDRVSGDLANLLTTVVSGSVALAAGTVSGGFGEALGIALLVGVVESGPIGWMIGAIGGLVATFGVLTLGRERLREGLKDVYLPAAALKVALWSTRYERLIADGRKKCEESVREALEAQMNQFAASIGDQIWNRLRAIIGESQRPGRAVE